MDPILERLALSFTNTVVADDGILCPHEVDPDVRAEATWSRMARQDAIWAAAASTSSDPFAKYPVWIEAHLDGDAETLLDAGCGYGRVSIPLLQRFPALRVLGVDASREMLRGFAELATRHAVRPRVLLYHGNLAHLPIASDIFDRVLSSAVLLHVPRAEAVRIVNELLRVLKPGARAVLVASFPNLWNLEGVQDALRERLWRDGQRNGPLRVYTQGQVQALFRGWREVQILEHGAIILPRHILHVPLPLGTRIRALNALVADRYLPRLVRSGCFIAYHDVVAVK